MLNYWALLALKLLALQAIVSKFAEVIITVEDPMVVLLLHRIVIQVI